MTVYPLVFSLGPITVTGYGLMMVVAFMLAGWVMQRDLQGRSLGENYAADIVIWAVVGGIVGGKLWYAALHGDPGSLLSRGGLVWYGGFLGGTLAVMINGYRRRVPLRFTMDLTAPALALGYAVGRVGCFLVQDDYGFPSSLPWAMKFPEGLPPSTAQNLAQAGASLPAGLPPDTVLAVHPTQLYETAAMMLAFWLLWRMRRHGRAVGWLFGLYLVIAGAERFLVEFLRAKDDRFFGQMTLAQMVSLALVAVGVALLYRWKQRDSFAIPREAQVLQPAESGS